ncbi:MAG: hypothetical protein WAO55_07205 [Candidatus Manganitrophaceae bacterium]
MNFRVAKEGGKVKSFGRKTTLANHWTKPPDFDTMSDQSRTRPDRKKRTTG